MNYTSVNLKDKNVDSLLNYLKYGVKSNLFFADDILSSYSNTTKKYQVLHSYNYWKDKGYKVKSGQSGIKVRPFPFYDSLEKYKLKESDNSNGYFFDISQVEKNGDKQENIYYDFKIEDKSVLIGTNDKFNYYKDFINNDKYYNRLIEVDIEKEYVDLLRTLVAYCFFSYSNVFGTEKGLLSLDGYKKKVVEKLDKCKEVLENDEKFKELLSMVMLIYHEIREDLYIQANSDNNITLGVITPESMNKFLDEYQKSLDNSEKNDYNDGNTMYYQEEKEVFDDVFSRTNEKRVGKTSANENNNFGNGESGNEKSSNENRDGESINTNIGRNGDGRNNTSGVGTLHSSNESSLSNASGNREIGNDTQVYNSNVFNGRDGEFISNDSSATLGKEVRLSKEIGRSDRKLYGYDAKDISIDFAGRTGSKDSKTNLERGTYNSKESVSDRANVDERVAESSAVYVDKESAINEEENGTYGNESAKRRNSESAVNRNDNNSFYLKEFVKSLKNLDDGEILFTKDEKDFLIDVLKNTDLINVNILNDYYATLNSYETLDNRDSFPFKLNLKTKNGNSITKNRDDLVDAIAFYMENQFDKNIHLFDIDKFNGLVYSINRKLFLMDYGIKDNIDKVGHVVDYSNTNIYELSGSSVKFLKENKDLFSSDIQDKINEFIFDDVNLDLKYSLNLQDNMCFTNRFFYEFKDVISNKYNELNESKKIGNLTYFDDEYDNYKGIIDLYEMVNKTDNLEKTYYKEQLKAIKYNNIISLSYDDLLDINENDKELFNKYVDITLSHDFYSDNKDKLIIYFNNLKSISGDSDVIKRINNYLDVNNLISNENQQDVSNEDVVESINDSIEDSNNIVDEIHESENVDNNVESNDNSEIVDDNTTLESENNEIEDRFYDISSLDKKFENFDFTRFNDLNDFSKPFNKDRFFELLKERKELMKGMKDKETEDMYVLCHIFGAFGDYYITDFDARDKDIVYGFACLSGMQEFAEYGSISLNETFNNRNKSLKHFCEIETIGLYGNERVFEYFLSKDSSGKYISTNPNIEINKDRIDYYVNKENYREQELKRKQILSRVEENNSKKVDEDVVESVDNSIEDSNIVVDSIIESNKIDNENSLFSFQFIVNDVSKDDLKIMLTNYTKYVFEKCLKNNDLSVENLSVIDSLFDGENEEKSLLNYIDYLYELGKNKNSNSSLYDEYQNIKYNVIEYINYNYGNKDNSYILGLPELNDYVADLILNKKIDIDVEHNMALDIREYLENDNYRILDYKDVDLVVNDIHDDFYKFFKDYDVSVNDFIDSDSLANDLYNVIYSSHNYIMDNGGDSLIKKLSNYFSDYDRTINKDNIKDLIDKEPNIIKEVICECYSHYNEFLDEEKNKEYDYYSKMFKLEMLFNIYKGFENTIINGNVETIKDVSSSGIIDKDNFNNGIKNFNNSEELVSNISNSIDNHFDVSLNNSKKVDKRKKKNAEMEGQISFFTINEDGKLDLNSALFGVSSDKETIDNNKKIFENIDSLGNENQKEISNKNVVESNDNSIEDSNNVVDSTIDSSKVDSNVVKFVDNESLSLNGVKNDYEIIDFTDDKFTERERFVNNCVAIETLYKIENEGRYATKEELDILAKYTGWGGLKKFLSKDTANIDDFNRINNLLDEEDFDSAKDSDDTAYYTPKSIINAIYQKISDMGFKGGNILEPSCAIGNFFGCMPREMYNNSTMTGVELDNISGRICRMLYPSVRMNIKGFQDYKVKNKFDLIIGNVPFGDRTIYDPDYNKHGYKIHDYFLNKCLYSLKNGGICAILTSTGTLDKLNSKAREEFSKEANFIGAIRLPQNKFMGTTTNCDVLFFQKNNENKLGYDQEFVNSGRLIERFDDVYLVDNKFKDKDGKIYTFERKSLSDYDDEFLKDLFSKQKLIISDKDDEIIINKDFLSRSYSYYLFNVEKMDSLYEEYKDWVEDGKKEEEKPKVDNLKDYLIMEQYYELNEDKEFLENYEPIKDIKVSYDNSNEIIINDSRGLVDISNTDLIREGFSETYLNTYFKENPQNIMGNFNTASTPYGKIEIHNRLDNNINFNDEFNKCLSNINCKYFKGNDEKEIIKDTDKEYVSDIEFNNLKLYEKPNNSYFILNNEVYFKEEDSAYKLNRISKKRVDLYKAVIDIRDTYLELLNNESSGNLDVATRLRKSLNEYFDYFNGRFKNSKGNIIHLADSEITKMFKNDSSLYKIQALENYESHNEETFTKLDKVREKGKLIFNVDYENNIYEKDVDTIINSFEYNGVKLYQLDDDKYYDENGNQYRCRSVSYKEYKTGDKIKSDIFFKPVCNKIEINKVFSNPKEALYYSLMYKGSIDFNYMINGLNGRYNKFDLINALEGEIYFDNLSNEYVSKDEFLTGNVVKRINDYNDLLDSNTTLLKSKTYDLEHGNDNDKVELQNFINELNGKINNIKFNIEALEKVKPVNIPFNAINIGIGTKWLPTEYYKRFLMEEFALKDKDGFGNDTNYDVVYNEVANTFVVKGAKFIPDRMEENIKLRFGVHYNNHSPHGNQERFVDPVELFTCAVNMQTKTCKKWVGTKPSTDPYKDDIDIWATDEKATSECNSKINRIKADFSNFIKNLPEEDKLKLEEIYNKKYNLFVLPDYTGKGKDLEFNGMNKNIPLHSYQKDVIYRAIQKGNTMFAHCVGAGKTFEMIATGMKFKELGLSKKNLYVVPKNLLPQWQSDFMKLYPNANILVPTKSDFEAKNRKKFLNKIANNNFDAIIMSYEQFSKIPLSKGLQEKYIKEDIRIAEETKKEMISIAQSNGVDRNDVIFNNQLRGLDSYLKERKEMLNKLLNNRAKDLDVLNFDDLHIDKLFVDEAHNFKNAYFSTKLGRTKGIVSQMTQRTYDMQLKCRFLNEDSNYKGVFFATGTPVANNVVIELYTMLQYLSPKKLEEMGISNIDTFISVFSEITSEFGLDATGSQFELVSRVSNFNNVPELMNLVNQTFDIINKNDLIEFTKDSGNKIRLPKVKRSNVLLPETSISKKAQLSLVNRADRVKKKEVDRTEDNMLVITTDGKKGSLDIRLVDKTMPEDIYNKSNAVSYYVSKLYKEYDKFKATQLIFCDYGLPNSKNKDGDYNFDVYNDIKKKLIENGVKESEIAFINDYDSPERKSLLSSKVNNGEIRVVIGGTQKLGTGMNLQKRCIALHHITIPYRPADMEQREGRIERQGNMFKNVYIFNYSKAGSFDARSYDILNIKTKGINQVINRKVSVKRNFTDEELCGEEEGSMNLVQMMADTINNPDLKRILVLQNEVDLLESQKSNLQEILKKNKKEVEVDIPKKIKEEENYVKVYTLDVDNFKKIKDNDFNLKLYDGVISKCVGEFKNKDDFDKNEGQEKFQNLLNSVSGKAGKVLICEWRGYKVFAEHQVGDDTQIFFESPVSNWKYVVGKKFNKVNLNRLDEYFRDIEIWRDNHNDIIKDLTFELNTKKESLNTSFENDKELIEKQEELKKLKEKSANDPNNIIKYDENGKVLTNEVDMEKGKEILRKQAEMLVSDNIDYEYPKLDKFYDADLMENIHEDLLKNEDLDIVFDSDENSLETSEIKENCDNLCKNKENDEKMAKNRENSENIGKKVGRPKKKA